MPPIKVHFHAPVATNLVTEICTVISPPLPEFLEIFHQNFPEVLTIVFFSHNFCTKPIRSRFIISCTLLYNFCSIWLLLSSQEFYRHLWSSKINCPKTYTDRLNSCDAFRFLQNIESPTFLQTLCSCFFYTHISTNRHPFTLSKWTVLGSAVVNRGEKQQQHFFLSLTLLIDTSFISIYPFSLLVLPETKNYFMPNKISFTYRHFGCVYWCGKHWPDFWWTCRTFMSLKHSKHFGQRNGSAIDMVLRNCS